MLYHECFSKIKMLYNEMLSKGHFYTSRYYTKTFKFYYANSLEIFTHNPHRKFLTLKVLICKLRMTDCRSNKFQFKCILQLFMNIYHIITVSLNVWHRAISPNHTSLLMLSSHFPSCSFITFLIVLTFFYDNLFYIQLVLHYHSLYLCKHNKEKE